MTHGQMGVLSPSALEAVGQNVGNFVGGAASEAAVQYATTVLQVPMVAVCGHSGCGAMGALLAGRGRSGGRGALTTWLAAGAPSLTAFLDGHPVGRSALATGFPDVDALAMVNVALQLDALRGRNPGQGGINPDVDAMGLFFDIPTARVLVLDHERQEFRPM